QLNANLNLSGIAHLPVHISNTKTDSMMQFFNNSFICWADQSWKKIIAIVKFYPFSTMDPSLKSQYQHLIAQTAYQNYNYSKGPQYAGKMYSSKVLKGQTDIASSKAYFLNKTTSLVNGSTWFPSIFDEVKKQHNSLGAPGLETKFKEDPD
ncbi:hypothetical protein VP01_13786g1, partial [Puccinia sorghi]